MLTTRAFAWTARPAVVRGTLVRSAFACRTWSSSSTGDKGTDDTSSRDTSTGDRALVQQRHESAVEAAANPLDAIVASLKDDDDGALAVRSRRDKSGSSSSSSTTTGRQQQRHGDAGITYRPLTAPKFEPVAVPSTVAELAQQRQLLVNRVRQHQRDVQAAVQKSLDHIVSQNRIVNAWLPHEHIEKLPEGMGVVHIYASRNNTIITLTDWRHVPVRTVTGGMCGLRGAHRGSLEAGTRVASAIAAVAQRSGFRQVAINLKGFGRGREPAFRAIVASGLKVLRIEDKTNLPHGGCKPKKARRV